MAEKTYNEFMGEVTNRYNNLSNDEKDVLRSIRGTQQGNILSKVLGTDFAMAQLGPKSKAVVTPKKRGLATR